MDDATRLLLVTCVCLPLRAFLVWLSFRVGVDGRAGVIQGALGAAVALGFARNELLQRRGETAPAGFFGGRVYWHRWAHALLYAGFAAAAFAGHPRAWAFLAADVLLGAVSVAHRYA